MCPLECETENFELTTTFDAFPAPGMYTQNLLQCAELANTFAAQGGYLGSMTYEQLASSLACVYIYYDDLKVTSVVESPEMTAVQLLANVGGTLGLFIGASCLTLAEMGECCVESLLILLFRKKKAKRQNFYNLKALANTMD
jgi:hypothetical protein